MLLLAHIAIAFAGLGLMIGAIVGKLRYQQSHTRLVKAAGASFIGLLATGFGLVASGHGQITSACLSGLVYFLALSALYAVYRYAGEGSREA